MKFLLFLLILAIFVSTKRSSENCGLIIDNVLFVLDDLISERYCMNNYLFYKQKANISIKFRKMKH